MWCGSFLTCKKTKASYSMSAEQRNSTRIRLFVCLRVPSFHLSPPNRCLDIQALDQLLRWNWKTPTAKLAAWHTVPPLRRVSLGRGLHRMDTNWLAHSISIDCLRRRAIHFGLKNALDWVYPEWNRKAAAFVSYGGASGVRSVQQLRETAVELQLAPIRSSVHIPPAALWAHFQGGDVDKSLAEMDQQAGVMIDDLLWWTSALKTARHA
jgi:hypothetical protein